ncbi:MAG: hypothetical protein ACYTHN_11610 [Planctomycetota bacterium]
MRIGIVGYPPQSVLSGYRGVGAEIIDLDIPRPEAPIRLADPYVPRVFCATLRTVLANALSLPLDLIIAAVGECKCDGMRFLVRILRDLDLGPVRETRNLQVEGRGTPISNGTGPLRARVDAIMEPVVTGLFPDPPPVEPHPPAGFWGVPPCDASVLDLFPEGTQILGWTRCVENGTPADLEIETFVPSGLPTIFYAQAFCQKNVLAKFLARKHNGLYVEADETISGSVRAKVEAFLALNAGGGEG